MKKTWLLVLIIFVMVVDTKFDLIEKIGLTEGWNSFIKLLGAVAAIVIAKFQPVPTSKKTD